METGGRLRHVYLLFVAALAVTLFGFWPSFYSAPGQLDRWRLLHGAFATLWLLMLIAQAWLIGRSHMRWHRRIGRASLVVVPAVIASALNVMHLMLQAGSGGFPRDLRLTLAWLDINSLIMFAALYALALTYRCTMRLHARFMGCTALVAVIPALGRAYGMHVPALGGLPGALDPSFLTVDAVLIVLLAFDATRRVIAAPYLITLACFIGLEATMWHAPHWDAFVALARAGGLNPAL